MIEIIAACRTIDERAQQVYANLARGAAQEDLAGFWESVAAAGSARMTLWEEFARWAQQGILPQLFDRPGEVMTELGAVRDKVVHLERSSRRITDLTRAFLAAFKLEFYLLYPAISDLFQYRSSLADADPHPVHDGYGGRLNRLFDGLQRYDLANLELELVGETIYRLWSENRRMAVQNSQDPLTGVLNRRGLFNAIKPLAHMAERNGMPVGMLMIDIDRFKEINDRHGHPHGDAVLTAVARRLQDSVRASDVLGRYGGEEFLVFVTAVEPGVLPSVAEKLRRAVADVDAGAGAVTVSIGICSGRLERDVDAGIEAMIREADARLYEAKAAGRNRVAGACG